MANRGKKYRAARASVDRNHRFDDVLDAIQLVKQTNYAKFDASIDVVATLPEVGIAPTAGGLVCSYGGRF